MRKQLYTALIVVLVAAVHVVAARSAANCKVVLKDVSSAQRAQALVLCSGSAVTVRIAPVLGRFASAWTGVTAVVDSNATALLGFEDIALTITQGSSFEQLDEGHDWSILSTTGVSLTLDGVQFSDCSAAGKRSSVVLVDGGKLTVANSTFTKCQSGFAGGAITTTSSNVDISNSAFVGNRAGVLGGAIMFSGTASEKLTISRSSFSRNQAGCKGGAVYAKRLQSATVSNTRFSYNENQLDVINGGSNVCSEEGFTMTGGAGMYFDIVSTVNVSDCNFLGGKSAGDGGAMVHNSGKSSMINSCNFESNSAKYGYGAAVEQTAINTTSISDSTFTENKGANNGALLVQQCSDVTVADNIFTSNRAVPIVGQPTSQPGSGGGGGGVTVQLSCDRGCTISGNNFTGNSAEQALGGGLLVQSAPQVNVLSNLFSRNSASTAGGGAAIIGSGVSAGNVNITSNTFTANEVISGSISSGGGLVLYQLPESVTSRNNFTFNSAGQNGGALWILGLKNSSALVDSCSFDSNDSGNVGGGIMASFGKLINIRTCIFSKNKAQSGGALTMDTMRRVKLSSNIFSRNAAKQFGGAIYASNCDNTTLVQSDFLGNRVQGSGGAINAQGYADAYIASCQFENNTARAGTSAGLASGGAIGFSSGSFAQVDACTFTSNAAEQMGGGVAFSVGDTGVITASNFTLNSAATDGGGVYFADMNNTIVDGSKLEGNSAENNGGGVFMTRNPNSLLNFTDFVENTAQGQGGGASSLNGNANLAVWDCYFGGNNATTSAGGLQISGSCLPDIERSLFDGNSAGEGGGLLISGYGQTAECPHDAPSCQCASAKLSPDAPPALTEVQLMNNTATVGRGGGLLVDGAIDVLYVVGSYFGTNRAATGGGGLSLSSFSANATTQISDTLLEGNIAAQSGGGIEVSKSPGMRLRLLSSNLTGNAAHDGGGVGSAGGSSISMANSIFEGNDASSGGGGLACSSCPALKVSKATFTANNAKSGGGGGFACSSCAQVTVQSTEFTQNSGGFAGGAFLGSSNLSHNAFVATKFTSNVAAGSNGQGGGGAMQVADGITVLQGSDFRNNTAAGSGGALLLSSSCSQKERCAVVRLDSSTFEQNTAEEAGGAVAGLGASLPLDLQCSKQDKADPIDFGTLADTPLSDSLTQVPTDCKSSFEGNTAAAYGNDLATGPSRLITQPSVIPRQRSSQRVSVSLRIVDSLGQPVSGSGPSYDLMVVAASQNASLTLTGQTRATAFNGSAEFTGLLARAPTMSKPYVITFSPANTTMTGASAAPASLDVLPAQLDITIQPCVTGEVAIQDLCVECSIGSFTFNSGIPCGDCPDGASCYGGASLVPNNGHWHSAPNSAQLHTCPRRSACRYDNRTETLARCQSKWYALEADTSLSPNELRAQQRALPCQLWADVDSDSRTTNAKRRLLASEDISSTDLADRSYMQSQCAEGYTGNLCGSCGRDSEGHRWGFYTAFQCARCQSDGVLVFLTILGFLLQFLFVLFTIFSNMFTNQQRYCANEAQPSDYLKVLVIYLQYNLIASKLELNWPHALLNFIGGVQIFFTSGEGIFSLDCLLQGNDSSVPLSIQRAIFNVLIPVALLIVCFVFWCIWWFTVQPFQRRRRQQSTEERVLEKVMAIGMELPGIRERGYDGYSNVSDVSDSPTPSRAASQSGFKSEGSSSSPERLETPRDMLEAGPEVEDTLKAIEMEIAMTKLKYLDDSKPLPERQESLQKALRVELAIQLEKETFGQYVQRILVVSVLVVCFFVYPTVCQAVLNTFACYRIDDGAGLYGNNQMAQWGNGYWQQDMNQRCYEGYHMTAVKAIGVPGAVLLCLGIPLATIVTLAFIRDRLDEPRTAATYGFLYHQFKPGFFWWSFVDQLRLLVLVVIVVFGRGLPAFVQLHLFIFVLLLSAAVSVLLQPHRFAGQMDLLSMSSIALIMFMSLYFIAYNDQPSSGLTDAIGVLCLAVDIVVIIFMLAMTVTRTRQHFIGYWQTFLRVVGKLQNGAKQLVERARRRRMARQASIPAHGFAAEAEMVSMPPKSLRKAT